MQNVQQWVEENRPDDDPDYQRLADVTGVIESEMSKTGPQKALDRRFDYDMTLKQGVRRTEETFRKVKLENPDFDTALSLLRRAWAEGFVFGALAYTQEHRGQKSEAFLDRIALANINHALAQASQDTLDEIFEGVVSPAALKFVSTVRSVRAWQILSQVTSVADHQMVKMTVASHWLDGFFVGLVFEELGGHRDKLGS